MRTLPVLTLVVACGPPPSGTLTLLTYNVQGLPDPLTESDRPGMERMEAIRPLLEPYDVVALQEDFDAEKHATLTATAHAEKVWFSRKVDENRVYGAGLSLLATPERTGYDEVHYARCHGITDGASDCLASKGFQRLTVMVGGVPLDLVNTHHEAGGGPDDVAARASQVDQVIDAIDDRPDRAVVLLGDLNLRPSDPDDLPLLARYADAGLVDGCDATGCPEPDHIDRILARGTDALALTFSAWENADPTFRFAEGDPMSDHPPIAITVTWEVLGRR